MSGWQDATLHKFELSHVNVQQHGAGGLHTLCESCLKFFDGRNGETWNTHAFRKHFEVDETKIDFVYPTFELPSL